MLLSLDLQYETFMATNINQIFLSY